MKTIAQLVKSKQYEEAIDLLVTLAEPKTGTPIRTPIDSYNVLKHYSCRKQESMFLITLNGSHEVIRIHEVTKGLVNKTMIHPREVYRLSIADNATSIILAHNHPSGNVNPSMEDNDVTTRMRQAGEIIGITMLDHVIIGRNGFYSYLQNGNLS